MLLLQLADALLCCPYTPFLLTPIGKLLDIILPISFPQQFCIIATPKTAKAAAVAVTSACKLATLITTMLQKALQGTPDQKGGTRGSSSSASSSSSSKPISKKGTTPAKTGFTSSKAPGKSNTGLICGTSNAESECPPCGPVVERSELTSEGWPAWLWYKVEA